jgi:integrase
MGLLSDPVLKAKMRTGQPVAGISDGDGLTWTLTKAGSASWVLRFRLAGRQREVTLGSYPDLSIAAARKAAREQRVRVDGGVDVAAEKRRQLREMATAGSFRALAEDYLSRAALALVERSRREVKRYLNKDILPRLGHLPAKEVTSGDIVAVVERVATRSDSVARRCFEILSVIFAHGVAKHYVPANPCVGLKLSAIIGPKPKRRERIKLDETELRRLLAALPTVGRENELAIRILLATCVRKGELIRAKWSQVDMENGLWSIPDENSKSGKGLVIPLAATVVGWFQELKRIAGSSEWVLPARKGKSVRRDGHMNGSTLNLALDRVNGDLREISPHDLRSTARSYLAALGVDLIVAERCLNHSLGGLVAVYDRNDYLEERKKALQLWANFLEDAERVRPSNVMPFKRMA